MTRIEEQGDTPLSGGGPQSNRRTFMKVGALATGGLLGSAGVARASGQGPAGAAPLIGTSDVPVALGSLNAYLFYGDSGIQGQASSNTVGGIDTSSASDVFAIDWAVESDFDPSRNTWRKRISPVVTIAKRPDSASVPLFRRYTDTVPINGAAIRFFTPHPGSGAMEHSSSLEFSNLRIVGIQLTTLDLGESSGARFELVSLAPQSVTVVDAINSDSHEIIVAQR